MNRQRKFIFLLICLFSIILSSCFVSFPFNSESETIKQIEEVVVTFYDSDKTTILQQDTIEKGDNANYYSKIPSINVDGKIASFEGWDKSQINILEDTDFYPVFNYTDIYYTVNFYNEDQLVDTFNVKHNDSLSYTKILTKESDEYFDYEFIGWFNFDNKSLENITSDLNFYAGFDSIRHSYKVTFIDYNEDVLEEKAVKIGEYTTYTGETPSRPEDVYNTYTFDKFVPDVSTTIINQDTIFEATYNSVGKKYSVVYKDYDGKILYEKKVYYQDICSYPYSAPERESEDPHYYYEFDKWIPQGNYTYGGLVTQNREFIASYEKLIKYCNVSFEGYTSYKVKYGELINPKEPLKSPKDGYTRDFIEWDYDFSQPVYTDIKIRAIWTDWYYTRDGLVTHTNYDASSKKYSFTVSCNNDYYSTFMIGYKSYYIQDEYGKTHVATISGVEDQGFKLKQNVKKIVFDNVSTLTYIGVEAFYKCQNLETVILNDYITKIEEMAFYGCSNLKTVYLPSSIEYIGELSFAFAGEPEVFYNGTPEQFDQITMVNYTHLGKSEVYFYSETKPEDTTYMYWHYVDGIMTPWE